MNLLADFVIPTLLLALGLALLIRTDYLSKRTKKRLQAPWWVRVPLYLAIWPNPEFYEYRVKLHRRFLKLYMKSGLAAARKMARREALHWWFASLQRPAYSVFVFVRRLFASN